MVNTSDSTRELYFETLRALDAKKWSKAQSLLERLTQTDNDLTIDHSAEVWGVPSAIVELIQDRIDAVNSAAE